MLARSLSECSGTFDRDIINFVRKNYNILIGDGTAEDVKKQLGCASDVKNMELMTLNGRHLISGLPENFVLSSEDVHQAIASSVRAIVDGIMTDPARNSVRPDTLKDTPCRRRRADERLDGTYLQRNGHGSGG